MKNFTSGTVMAILEEFNIRKKEGRCSNKIGEELECYSVNGYSLKELITLDNKKISIISCEMCGELSYTVEELG